MTELPSGLKEKEVDMKKIDFVEFLIESAKSGDIIFFKKDVLDFVDEQRGKVEQLEEDLWDICVLPQYYNCDKCPFWDDKKEICNLFTKFDEVFGCEKPTAEGLNPFQLVLILLSAHKTKKVLQQMRNRR